jgi:hypothetical protein
MTIQNFVMAIGTICVIQGAFLHDSAFAGGGAIPAEGEAGGVWVKAG